MSAIVREFHLLPSLFIYFIGLYVFKERRLSMSLRLMEQRETQEEGFSLTAMFDRVQAHSAAQLLNDATIPADDLLTIFTENELEEQEELDTLDAAEASLDVDEADRRE